jgi:hypothetical protein
MSRSHLPPRPSEYRPPVFMNELPDEADEEAAEMARRHGVDEARSGARKAKPGKSAKPGKPDAAKPDADDDA